MSFDIYAQADVVTTRVTLAPRSAAGNLETTLMEAIGAGATSPHDLANVFGLAPRLVLQVLGDLWRAGRVSVEMQTNYETLSLTTEGKHELDATAAAGALSTTATTATTQDIIVERLTGRALAKKASVARVPFEDRDLVVPAAADDRPASGVSGAEMVAALSAGDSDLGGVEEAGGQRVVSAFLQPDMLQVVSRRRYVKLRAAAQVTETDELTVAVIDDRLTLSERDQATRRLQGIVDSQPKSKFTMRLRQHATKVALQTRGIAQILDELRRHLDTLDGCPYGERQQRHDRAAALVSQVTAYAQSRSAREMDVEVVSTTERHQQVVADLIQRAERQLVFAVPWIRAKGLEPLRGPLLAALGRGVQVVLVWGIDGHNDGLGSQELAWLDSITAHVHRSSSPGRFVYSRSRGARSHAKLVISDDRQMLVTSKNFLSRSNHTEVGVLLSSLDNQRSPVIEAGLQYVYDKSPSPDIAFALHRLPGAFGARDSAPDLSFPLPRLQQALLQQEAPEDYVRAWATAWSQAGARAQAILTRPRPTVETVADLQHRGVVREAVTSAASRVLLASDKLTETALSQDLAAVLTKRAAEGVAISIRYRDAPTADVPGLNVLQSASSPPVDVVRTPSMHAKVVLRDDTSLVGSFNPLSVDANLRKRRSTGEFGVVVDSSRVADAVWAAVAGTPVPATHTSETRLSAAERPSAYLAQSLLDAIGESSSESLLALTAEHGLGALLDAKRSLGLDLVDDLRLAGAGLAVALETDTDPTPAATLALDGLLRTGNWGVAALLRPLIPDALGRPRKSFTSALSEGSSSGQSLTTALTSGQEPTEAEADALIVTDCVHLLLGDNPSSSADSELLFSSATPSSAIDAFFSASVAYLRRYGALPAIPPAIAMSESDLADEWRAAEEACIGFGRYDSKSGVGNRLIKYLTGPVGELGLLDAILNARDASALLDWRDHYLQVTDDAKWLDRVVRDPGLPRITDSRRRSFTEHRRKVRVAVSDLCSALERRNSAEHTAWSPEQIASLNLLLQQVERLAADADRATPEGTVLAAEATRILTWAEGSVRSTPARDWRGWAFVETNLVTAPDPGMDVPLASLARDLAADRSLADAVEELARGGEYEQAQRFIESGSRHGSTHRAELTALLRRHIAESQDRITAQLRTLGLACERAGVPEPPEEELDVCPRLADAEAKLADLVLATDAAIDARREDLLGRLPSVSGTTPGWQEYIRSLIQAGDLVLAEHALTLRDGDQELPRPKSFARWSWRDNTTNEVATWFAEPATAPSGAITKFTPNEDDKAGRAVIDALRALRDEDENAPQQWIAAVQQLLAPEDDYVRPHVTVAGEHITATFRMPYDQRLPLLRWAREDEVTVAVGATAVPGTLLRFPLNAALATGSEALVEIGDVLSLLARADTDRTPTATERSLQFLALVCSRLELASIIEPPDMPAGGNASSRHRLAWLLSTLGLTADGQDVDRLSVWSGGHPGVLWSLVQEARRDPATPAGSVVEHPDRDQVLLRGVDLDLDNDEDLLVLGLGLAWGILRDGCSEAELAALFEDEWTEGRRNPNHRVRISEVVHRLKSHGYIREKGDRLYSCGCLTARAVERIATQDWLADRMDLIDPDRLIHEAAYEFILEMLRHQQQAEGARLSEAEMADRAHERLAGRLEDDTAFDLVQLCDTVRREYSRSDIDVLSRFPDAPLLAKDAGPAIWIECLAFELLNNAIAATSDLAPDEATIWMMLERDPSDNDFAVLSVRNNGRRFTEDAREAFETGRRLLDANRPKNGTGLHRFKRFGETRGVHISLSETANEETVVRCRIPLVSETQSSR
ncbi:hypothetical protein [Nocardioides sp. T2.26MG-1]|uniref:hypothetical protein n=1 Tax=Nocardioides sp. T2.26MG-1 TaxID=3041166 RepID=UPI002477BEB4|nr:hypothetical protein [Nocardioides sp. T2.26MG-1]CAI9413160.1 hypothetical protein HIDPHFAB_01951 [Nocardioides sp. T2.26MG-1]